MTLGLSTYTFPWAIGVPNYPPPKPLSFAELIQKTNKLGIRCLQIGDNLPLHTLSAKEWKNGLHLAQQLNIQLEIGTRGLRRKHIQQYLTFASQCQSPFLRLVIDDGAYQPAISEIKQIIQELLPELEARNIILAIENHDRFKAAELVNIIEATSKRWVGICLDTANSLGANEGTAQIVDTLLPYIVNLHIKDIQIARLSHKMGFKITGCAAGEGILDIPDLLQIIAATGRCFSATLEIWSEAESTVEASVEKEEKWAAESIDYLMSYFPKSVDD